jgi:hypothetical protein
MDVSVTKKYRYIHPFLNKTETPNGMEVDSRQQEFLEQPMGWR